jgi:hypothetical protein
MTYEEYCKEYKAAVERLLLGAKHYGSLADSNIAELKNSNASFGSALGLVTAYGLRRLADDFKDETDELNRKFKAVAAETSEANK